VGKEFFKTWGKMFKSKNKIEKKMGENSQKIDNIFATHFTP
jgi:hypothetical protein